MKSEDIERGLPSVCQRASQMTAAAAAGPNSFNDRLFPSPGLIWPLTGQKHPQNRKTTNNLASWRGEQIEKFVL